MNCLVLTVIIFIINFTDQFPFNDPFFSTINTRLIRPPFSGNFYGGNNFWHEIGKAPSYSMPSVTVHEQGFYELSPQDKMQLYLNNCKLNMIIDMVKKLDTKLETLESKLKSFVSSQTSNNQTVNEKGASNTIEVINDGETVLNKTVQVSNGKTSEQQISQLEINDGKNHTIVEEKLVKPANESLSTNSTTINP